MDTYIKTVSENRNIDQKHTRECTNNKFMASRFEAYACAITKQKIDLKYLIHRRVKMHQQRTAADNKCRLCKKPVQDVTHVLSSFSKVSSRYYLLLRHDFIAKYVYEKFREKKQILIVTYFIMKINLSKIKFARVLVEYINYYTCQG